MFKVNNDLKKLGSLIVNVGFDIYFDGVIDQFSFSLLFFTPLFTKAYVWHELTRSAHMY